MCSERYMHQIYLVGQGNNNDCYHFNNNVIKFLAPKMKWIKCTNIFELSNGGYLWGKESRLYLCFLNRFCNLPLQISINYHHAEEKISKEEFAFISSERQQLWTVYMLTSEKLGMWCENNGGQPEIRPQVQLWWKFLVWVLHLNLEVWFSAQGQYM